MKVKRTRAHRVLFAADSPFRHRVVRDRTLYTRKIKHRHLDQNG